MYRYAIVGLIGLLLCGAISYQSRTTSSAADVKTAFLAGSSATPTVVPAAAAPIDVRKEQLRLNMRGLKYDSGRVVIDQAFAATIADRGSRAAAEAELARGDALMLENDWIEAIGAFTHAVLILPQEPRYYAALGRALEIKGKDAEAEAAFRTGLDLAPESTGLRYALADLLARRANLDGAIAEFRTLLEQDPQYPDAHTRLAIQLYYVGDKDGAWEHVRAAEALGQEVPPQFVELLSGQMPPPVVGAGARSRHASGRRSEWTPAVGRLRRTKRRCRARTSSRWKWSAPGMTGAPRKAAPKSSGWVSQCRSTAARPSRTSSSGRRLRINPAWKATR